jgi:GAF domain-containing protein
MSDQQPLDPNDAFVQLGRIKLADSDIGGILSKVADLAQRAIPGADEVSLTLIRGRRPYTATFTGELALACDERQYQAGHGPCLDAAERSVTLSLPDMERETRWPDYVPRAAEAGVHSSLSIGLPVQEAVRGALNIYATKPDAFDDDAVMVAQTFAAYAAVALANAHLYDTQVTLAEQMQAAMESRAVIEQAKGIIMGDRRCSADEAFAILSKISQDTNRKVREVAIALVATAQGSGDTSGGSGGGR